MLWNVFFYEGHLQSNTKNIRKNIGVKQLNGSQKIVEHIKK